MKSNLSRMMYSVAMLLLLMNCGGETPKTPNEKTEELLRSITWRLTTLTVDGVSSDRYARMTLQFGTGTYTTTGGAPVWPALGTWVFEGTDGKRIKREDGLLLTVESASAAQIVLSFDWSKTTYTTGRMLSVAGKHLMTFVKG
ncbi:MAG: hypothetical protein ACKOYP_00305 [Bacteroidota bacterium]